MYIYHVLINALRAHRIHINLSTIFYTHVEDSPTKTIYTRHYMQAHTHMHARTHTYTDEIIREPKDKTHSAERASREERFSRVVSRMAPAGSLLSVPRRFTSVCSYSLYASVQQQKYNIMQSINAK